MSGSKFSWVPIYEGADWSWPTEQEARRNFREQTVPFGEGRISEPVNYHPRVFDVRVIVGGSLKILDWDLGLAAAVFEGRVERTINRLTS